MKFGGLILILTMSFSELCYGAQDQAFTFDDLATIANDPKTTSVEALLEQLPKSMFEKFVLVRSSESTQGATDEAPRVILWNEESGFAMSFNGDSTLSGFESIESFQYIPGEKRLQFNQISFSDSKASVTEPQFCFGCHGSSPRPIWQQYPFWNKAYGSQNDFFNEDEKAAFTKFKDKATAHPRYKHLSDAFKDRQLAPFKDSPGAEAQSLDNTLLRRQNLRLNIFLNRLNAQRLLKDLVTQFPDSELVEISKSILECPETLKPQEIMSKLSQQIQDWDMRSTIFSEEYNQAKWDRPYFDGSATVLELVGARLVEYLLEKKKIEFDSEDVFWLLDKKYDSKLDVYAQQRPIVLKLDSLGGWLPVPFTLDDEFIRIKRTPITGAQKIRWKRACTSLTKDSSSK